MKMIETINDQKISFVADKATPQVRFLASLSDGRTVIQDDRQGERHAWSRLAEWLKENTTITITGLRMQGPNGVDVNMPSNQRGYFFGNKQMGVWGGSQQGYCGIGYYDGQMVNVSWHRQPNFDNTVAEERTVAKAGFMLIKNN